MVRPCSKNGRRKIAQNSIEVEDKTKESMKKTEEKLDGRNKEGHNRKKPKGSSVGRQKAMESRCRTTYIYIYAFYMFWPLHGHPQGGLQQRSTIMADSVIDVHMWSQNTQCLQ